MAPPRNYTLKFDHVLSPPTMKWDLRPCVFLCVTVCVCVCLCTLPCSRSWGCVPSSSPHTAHTCLPWCVEDRYTPPSPGYSCHGCRHSHRLRRRRRTEISF